MSPCGKRWSMLPSKVDGQLLVGNGVYPLLYHVLLLLLLSNVMRGCSSAVPI